MKKFLLSIVFLVCVSHISFAQWDRDVFEWRGRNALQDGKYAQAIENFNILVRLDDKDYWSYFFRGIAKYNLGDFRGALQDFDSSVRINPVFTNGYHYRAITKSRIGDYDAAQADFQEAISLRPGFEGLYFSRGVNFFLAQRFDDAVKDFDYFIQRVPKDPSAYLNRGASYLFLGDTLKALDDYNKAIKLDRFEAEGYIRRGRLYAQQQYYDLAIEDMNKAVTLDSTNTFAFFNRAIMFYETKNYNGAMADLNRVLAEDPGNALTLYNRSLVNALVGNYSEALEDMDRVININPSNVLAYFNRASVFIEMGRYSDALSDYSKAIELYPDFAKAYMNRAYVENLLGLNKASKQDYDTARKKVREYNEKGGSGSLADTTKQYSKLLTFDAEFAKKDFDDELLQHRDIDIKLRPLYRFRLTDRREQTAALSHPFENPLLEKFIAEAPVQIDISNENVPASTNGVYAETAEGYFARGLRDLQNKQFGSALTNFDKAVKASQDASQRSKYEKYYSAFYLMNRGVLRSEMIDFIASIESNVQTLTMDDQKTTRARVSDRVARNYDYSEAIADMQESARILPDIPYSFFNLGNLYCLSSQFVESIDSYTKAIELYPYMGDAYYNRGLVLIFVKDKEKGCIDLSRAGELGVKDAYAVISKHCKDDDN